jgi:plastocyanin
MARCLKYGTAAAAVVAVVLAIVPSALADPTSRTVLIKDKCDTATFDAVLGKGACTRGEGVAFGTFVNQLTVSHQAGGWRFAPGQLSISPGTDLVVVNTGGETHTFTPVPMFGPGFVPFLNLLVFGVAGPPVAAFPPSTFVPAGATVVMHDLAPGTYMFQCGIHPWMQTTVTVG